MTAHAPKIAALIAHREGVLSTAGTARIEKHLASCAACRRARATIDVYESTARVIRDAEPPTLDWGKMELALAREARAVAEQQRAVSSDASVASVSSDRASGTPSPSRAARPGRAAPSRAARWGVVAAAALALIALRLSLGGGASDVGPIAEVVPREDPTPRVDPLPEPALLTASVTLVAGRAVARDASGGVPGAERALAAGDVIDEGIALATDEGSQAHLSIGDGSRAVALLASTEASLARMREDGIEIALASGTVASAVAPTEASARFVVLAAEHRFEAVGTRFEVDLDASSGALHLQVDEGTVEVRAPDGSVVLVAAPGSWSSPPGERAEHAVVVPHGIGDGPWSRLTIAHPEIVRWEIDGLALDGAGAIDLRMREGEHAVAGFDASGRAFRTVAIVGADGLTIGASDLTVEPVRQRPGFLPQADIVAVVRNGMRRVQSCYERAMRDAPDLGGSLMMRITVGLDGSVTRARVIGGDVPDVLRTCAQTEAERWGFPPPEGGPVTFDVPLSFTARAPR